LFSIHLQGDFFCLCIIKAWLYNQDNRYFYVGDNISQKSPGLKKGIYLRKNKKISLVMVQNPTPSFVPKFNFFNYTEDEVTKSFEKNILKEMNKAF
jgi:hypothetical protein